jgi:hypothetical protein
MLDKRLELDTAAYYMNWRDVQQSLAVLTPTGVFLTATVNGPAASGVGVDLALTIRPIDGLELGTTFSWNDLSLDDNVYIGSQAVLNKGDRLNSSPKDTVGAFGDYTFPLGGTGLHATFAISGNYSSRQVGFSINGAPPNLTTTVGVGDRLILARASFDIKAAKHWTGGIYVDNLTNERGTPGNYPVGQSSPLDWNQRFRPRTLGAQLEYHFR